MKQTVLITGASGGLGLALAHRFAKEGYDLILTARSADKLTAAKAELEAAYGVGVTSIPHDLGAPRAAETLMATIREQGLTVDILVNNAGFGDFGTFADSDIDKQSAMVQLNITALMELTHAALPAMRQRKQGKILNVASIAAFEQGPYMSVYYATKAFVLSFSQALARELKGSGITVTALCPGPIHTGFFDAADLDNSKLFRSLPVAHADDVADYGYKALMKGKTVAVHGTLNKLLVFSVRFAPRGLVSNVIYTLQGEISPKS